MTTPIKGCNSTILRDYHLWLLLYLSFYFLYKIAWSCQPCTHQWGHIYRRSQSYCSLTVVIDCVYFTCNTLAHCWVVLDEFHYSYVFGSLSYLFSSILLISEHLELGTADNPIIFNDSGILEIVERCGVLTTLYRVVSRRRLIWKLRSHLHSRDSTRISIPKYLRLNCSFLYLLSPLYIIFILCLFIW